jgi:hypothetical protein
MKKRLASVIILGLDELKTAPYDKLMKADFIAVDMENGKFQVMKDRISTALVSETITEEYLHEYLLGNYQVNIKPH